MWTVLCVERKGNLAFEGVEIEIVGELACNRRWRPNGRAAAARCVNNKREDRPNAPLRFLGGNARTHFELLALAAGPAAHSRAKERRSVEWETEQKRGD